MNKSLQIAGVSVVSAAVGLTVGYKIAEKRLSAQFEERLDRETGEMKSFYTQVKKPYATPEEAVADLIPPAAPENPPLVDPRQKAQKVQYNKIVKTEAYVAVDDEQEGAAAAAEEVVVQNVFQAKPSPDSPYVISQDDFMGNETGYSQATLTYYSKGGTLADEREEIIDDQFNTVGSGFEAHFGHDSSDPNVVHIRNAKLQMEFEIVLSEQSYAEDVLGQEEPPESPRARMRREG